MSFIQKKIDIFEFNTNLGLRKTRESEPGGKLLPNHFKQYGLHDLINPNQIYSLNAPNYQMVFDKKTQILNQLSIRDYAIKQAQLMNEKMNLQHFNLILGGDCSILLVLQ